MLEIEYQIRSVYVKKHTSLFGINNQDFLKRPNINFAGMSHGYKKISVKMCTHNNIDQ